MSREAICSAHTTCARSTIKFRLVWFQSLCFYFQIMMSLKQSDASFWPNAPSYFYTWVKVVQSCPTLCNPMDHTTVHGILQAKILEWVAFPFSRGSSQLRDRTQVSHIVGRHFTVWATREVLLQVNPDLNQVNANLIANGDLGQQWEN